MPVPANDPDEAAYEVQCEEVQQLFDTLAFEREIREWEVFRAVFGDRDAAHAYMCSFLEDVAVCPEEVLEHVRALLREGRAT